MPRPTSPSGILEWISKHARPSLGDSATLRFERMPAVGLERIPEIDAPLDPGSPAHWHHRGLIWDIVISLGEARRVLDIGPGDGWPALLLAPHFAEVVGIEPGPRRLEVCRANAARLGATNARFELMSACAMTFGDRSFDGVVATTAIEQTADPGAALREIFRVLRPGGALRLRYEVLDGVPEPVREAVSLRRAADASYLVDYTVSFPRLFEQRDYLVEIVPATAAAEKRLIPWAERCAGDTYPHRDPRLERGLTRTILSLSARDVRGARSFRLKHFQLDRLIGTLARIGFSDVRPVAGGGKPAEAMARELQRAQRLPAAAPLMEELCRAAAVAGLGLTDPRGGDLVARKPERSGRAPVRGRKAPRT